MNSSPIETLRSVALYTPNLAEATRFYTDVWHLNVVEALDDAVYLRATGDAHHVLSLHCGTQPGLRDVTLRARSEDALRHIAQATVEAGGTVLRALAPVDEPGGGVAVTVRDPDGRILRVVHGDVRHGDAHEAKDRPIRLAHVVLNSRDVPSSQAFFERAFGCLLADRTRIMAFMNINRDHHSIALGDADNNALNHIAFLMPDIDSVMRGGGRMRDAGHAIEWGPGRHGPGNNAFNYFIGPDGVVIEYTAEVEQIDDTYRVGGPSDWVWPPGRIDRWGISAPPSADLKQAQRSIHFIQETNT
jgi:catechol 2,3-dioxygenase-like lactoylglutathione lyase family enzyme